MSECNVLLFEDLRGIKQGYDDIRSDRFFTMGGAGGIRYTSKIKWLDENGIVGANRRAYYLKMFAVLEETESSFFADIGKNRDGNGNGKPH